MHRLGLSEVPLVFPEHRAFSAPAGLPALLAALRRSQPEKELVVETADADETLVLAPALAGLPAPASPAAGGPGDAAWFAARALVPAALSWLRVDRAGQPALFSFTP